MIAATVRDQRARSYFSASALFSERLRGAACSVKRDIIASQSLHENIAEITVQELSVLYWVLFDFIRQRLNKIIANYVFLMDRVSVIISYLSC